MPRLNQKFYREVNILVSPRSTEDESSSLHKEANSEGQDRTGGMPSLAEWLWVQTEESRRKVLSTHFIQGLKTGTLDPIKFGVFNIEDVVYCLKTIEALKIAAKRASGNVKSFLEDCIQSYEEYSTSLTNQWRIKSADSVLLGSSLSKYIRYHDEVANTMEPIYMVLSLIPCARLWPWIGEHITGQSATFGVYEDWVGKNLVGDDYKGIENFLNQNEALIDRKYALKVYKECMNGEFMFFHRP